MRTDYPDWLRAQGYADNTCVAQLHRVKKVEEAYGALDEHLANATFDAVVESLTYSTQDERHNRPNPSQIDFQGNIRNNLASYKNAATRYARFWEEVRNEPESVPVELLDRTSPRTLVVAPTEADPEKQRLALERDMQRALRRDIVALEPGLNITDEDSEQQVGSGFIDILCKDGNGHIVVVELKAGRTDARVVAQILGYMGDLAIDEPDTPVRGIIVAHDFDKRTIAAARAVPNLTLMTYSMSFSFDRLE